MVLSLFGGKSKPNGRWPRSISRADGQRLFDGDEEVQNYLKRNFQGFLAYFLLKSGEGDYLPAFVIDCHLLSRLEIFDRPKKGNARMVGFFGNKLKPLLQEDKGVICHVGLRADGVRVSWV